MNVTFDTYDFFVLFVQTFLNFPNSEFVRPILSNETVKIESIDTFSPMKYFALATFGQHAFSKAVTPYNNSKKGVRKRTSKKNLYEV